MPVIAVNLSAQVFGEVSGLVSRGTYGSPEQFLETAAFNQLALERGARPADLTSGRSEVQRNAVSAPVEIGAKRLVPATYVANRGSLGALVLSEMAFKEANVRLRLQKDWDSSGLPTTKEATRRSADERIWGQVNRLFPLKLAVRWLMLRAAGDAEWPAIGTISDGLGTDAATVGSFLESLDMQAELKRDDQLATGLPRRGNAASQDRFISQIVARTTRSGGIHPGALCHYAMAEFDGDRLVLTNVGMELAMLQNVLLDGGSPGSSGAGALSEDERALFSRIVRDLVPGELSQFRNLIGSIRDGARSPEAVKKALRPLLSALWTEVMVRTHIAGLMSRAADLGMVHRTWVGRHVEYAVTDRGMALLD